MVDKLKLLDENKEYLLLVLGLILTFIVLFSPILEFLGTISRNLNLNLNLIKINVFFVFIILIIYIYLFLVNFSFIKFFFKDIKKNTWVVLFIIVIISFIFNFYLSQHHMRIQDEFIYTSSARQLINTGTQDLMDRGIGWPLLISFVFLLFGDVGLYAFYFSSFLAVISVFVSFLLFYTISKDEIISLISSFLFSLSPLIINYSSWAETNFPSLFFFLISLTFFFLYIRIRKIKLFLLFVSSFSFFFTFRGENYLFIIPVLFGFIIYRFNFKLLFNKKIIFFLTLILFLSLPQFLLYSNVYFTQNFAETQYDATGGENISFENLNYNIKNYIVYLFNGATYPLFYLLFLILGLIYSFISFKKEFIFFIFYFFSILFTMFLWWIGPYEGHFPAQLRYTLVFIPVLSFFTGVGIFFITSLIFKTKIFKVRYHLHLLIIFLIIIFPFLFNSMNIISDYRIGNEFSLINKLIIDLGNIISNDSTIENCTIISINYHDDFIQISELFNENQIISSHYEKKINQSECLLLTDSPHCDFFNSDFFEYYCNYFKSNFNKSIFKYYELDGIYFPLYKLEKN
ncbi:MAG: hypothetical protein ACOCRX_03710 [Candidatus Woesearchaeota archaeon]